MALQRALVFSRFSPSGVALILQPRATLDPEASPSAMAALMGLMPGFVTRNTRWVLVKVGAIGVNPVDAKYLFGDKSPAFTLPLVRRTVEGLRVCLDFSGVVVSAEPGSGFNAGEEVFGVMPPHLGAAAEFVRAPADQICLRPTRMTMIEAAGLGLSGLTALQAMERVRSGDRVLIIGGSGGTGHIAIQVAIARGARVTTVCGFRNVELCRSFDVSAIVAYDNQPPEAFDAALRDKGPFDLILDTVSSADMRDAHHNYEGRVKALLSSTGSYVCLGGPPSDWARALLMRSLGVNCFPSNHVLHWVHFAACSSGLHELAAMVDAGQLRVKVGMQLPFTEDGIRRAFELLNSRRTVGKIILVLDEDWLTKVYAE
jgi:NADPH:quinone reductase-like Zn-dependent oxidoreductase